MSRNFLAQRSAISSMGSTAAVSQMTTSITVGSQVESRVPATNMSFPERNVTIIDPSTIRFPGRNQLYLSKFSLTRKGELNGSGTALAVKAFLKVSPSLPPSSSVAEIAAAAISGPSIAANVGITQDTIPAEGIGSTNGPLPTLEETSGGNNNSNHSPIIMRKTLHGSIEMNNSSERIEMTGIATQHPPLTTPSLQQTNIPTSNNITSSKLGSSSGVMVNRLRSQSQIESRTNNHKRNTSNSATMNSIILGGGAGTALGSGGAANVKTRSALNIGGSIDHPEYTEQLSQLFKRQATEMSSANHKRLVAMFGIIPQQFSVIMEYFPMGSLEDFISSKQKSWRRRDQYCCAGDIAEGMDYLHSVLPESDKDLIVHMSLRSSNVLIYLDRGYARAKISDFGFAEFRQQLCADGRSFYLQTDRQLTYAAPEIKLDPKFCLLRTSVDVYAFGIILVEIFAEVSPQLARADYVNLLKERPKIPQTIELIALGCLEEMPSIRPSFRKIMERLQFQKENILKGAPMLDENMASGSVEGGNSRRPRHNRDAESNNNNNSNENEDGETPTVGGNSRSRVRSNPNHVRSHTSSRSAAASIIKKRWCDFCYSFGENSNGRKTFWSKQKLLLAIFLVILVIIATIVGALSKIGMSGSGAVGGGSSQLSSASSTPTSS